MAKWTRKKRADGTYEYQSARILIRQHVTDEWRIYKIQGTLDIAADTGIDAPSLKLAKGLAARNFPRDVA